MIWLILQEYYVELTLNSWQALCQVGATIVQQGWTFLRADKVFATHKIRYDDEQRRKLEEETTARAILADPSHWPDQDGYWIKWAKSILHKNEEQET